MATMNISLPQDMKDWVEQQAETGKYANSSDYVRDVIRKDIERRESSMAMLANLIEEGLDSGASSPWNLDEFLEKMHKQHNARDKDISDH